MVEYGKRETQRALKIGILKREVGGKTLRGRSGIKPEFFAQVFLEAGQKASKGCYLWLEEGGP